VLYRTSSFHNDIIQHLSYSSISPFMSPTRVLLVTIWVMCIINEGVY